MPMPMPMPMQAAVAAVGPLNPGTIFAKIINKEIPATILHEDEHCIAFTDAFPVAPTHTLVIPRKPIARLSQSVDTNPLFSL